MRIRYAGFILFLLLLIAGPIVAQDNTERFIAYGELAGDRFASNADDSHDWQLQADAGDIVEIQLRRIGGVFVPRLELIAPDGSNVSTSIDTADDYGQQLVFQDALQTAGTYLIRVSQSESSSDGLLTQSEYSLGVSYRGQISETEARIQIPDSITQAQPDYFTGDADTESFPEIEIFGDVTVTQIDPVNMANQFLLTGTRTIEINDTNVVSRLVERIAFSDEGIALQINTGTVFLTNANISNLSLDASILTIALDNNRLITTDFYDIDTIIAEDERTLVRLLDDEILVFDEPEISLTRLGGIAGQGPNAEPALVIRTDADEIQTDISGWQTLSIENEILTVDYENWHLSSDELSASLLQQGNRLRPDLDSANMDTGLFDIQINHTQDESLSLIIDPLALREVQISNGAVSVDFLDNRQIVDELPDVDRLVIANQAVRLNRIDGTVNTILPDSTRILTSASIPVNDNALVSEPGFRPQNFNNAGTTVSDYHPRVDMDFALEPVNRVTGNFIYPVQDYAIQSPALALDWSRTYNSMVAATQTPDYMHDNATVYADFGNNWRHSYQIELDVQFAPKGEVRLILADASIHIFEANNDGNLYRSNSLLSWTIEQISDFSGDWIAYSADGIQYHFDAAGRLQRISDIQGHVLLFSPVPRDYLAEFNAESGFFITDSYGRRLEVYTNASAHIITVREVQGRSIHYRYHDDNLVEVDYPGEAYTATYNYREGNLVRIEDVNSPYARSIALDYNSNGQVSNFSYYPDDDLVESYNLRYEDNRTVQFWRVTGTDNRNDNRESIFEYNSDYRLTSRTVPGDNRVYQWRYNQETGLLSEIAQPTRAVLRFSYDQSGYLIRFTDPLFGSGTGSYTLIYESGAMFTRRLIQIDAPDTNEWLTLRYDDSNRLQEVNRLISGTANNRRFHQTRYSYNDNGELHQIIEPGASGEDLLTSYDYDAFGYPRSISIQARTGDDSSIRQWQLLHDAAGRLLRIQGDEGRLTTLNWNNDRNLLLNLSIDAEVYQYDYDLNDNLIAYTAPGITERYEYDGKNQVKTLIDAFAQTSTYTYDSAGNLITIMLPGASQINYRYDALDNLLSSTSKNGFETRYAVTLNQGSNRTIHSVTNPLDEQTQYQFDPLGRLRQVSDFDSNGNPTFRYNLTYNARGNLTEILDNGGRTLSVTYDFAGNPLLSSINRVVDTEYAYNDAGLIERLTTPAGQSIAYEYDLFANPVRAILPDGTEQRFEYDLNGNLQRFIDASGNSTEYQYDAFNRLMSETNSLLAITEYHYDEAGNLRTLIEPGANRLETVYTYDALNRLTEWVNPAGGTSAYEYDISGNLIEIVEPNRLQTTFTYDISNNVVALTQPDDREFLYGRDIAGRVISETNPSGQTTVYSYNIIGKIGRIVSPQGSIQSFSWLGNGRPARYSISNGAEYEYIADDVGRLIEIVDLGTDEATAVNTRIEYNANGQITSIRQGNRLLITGDNATIHRYTYDEAGRVATYLPPGMTSSYQFDYDNNGNLIALINPDNIETQYLRDANARIVEVISVANTESPIHESYDYDAAGNVIISRTADGIERHYTYDTLNRLIELREIGLDEERVHAFAYDAVGRITRYVDPLQRETIYRYDLFGNPVAIEQSSTINDETITRTTRYQYDALDNLIRVEAPEGQVITMTYNGSGQRVRYVDAANNSQAFSYDNTGNIAQRSDPLGNNQSYEFDVSNRPLQMTFATGASVNFSYDGLGNLNRVLLPETADTASREQVNYGFDPAANLISITHAANNTTVLERDASGRVETIRTAQGAEITLAYDAFGHITKITTSGNTINRDYDPAGRLTGISDDNDRFRIEYDAYGQISAFNQLGAAPTSVEEAEVISQESEIILLSNSYEYDVAGNIIRRDAGEYGIISYEYDAFDRPIRIALNEEWVEIDYNNNGWRTTIRRSNGVETRYSYDANGRVRNIAHINADNQRLDGFAYEYDAVGNIIRVTRGDNRAILYSYDAAQQLISERWLDESNQIVYSVNYTYDAAANRIEQSTRLEGESESRSLFKYNNRNQLISESHDVAINIEDRFALPVSIAMIFTLPFLIFARRRPRWIILILLSIPLQVLAWQPSPEANVLYEYDLNGNLIHEIYPGTEQINYIYDDLNRLISVETVNLAGEIISETTVRYNAIGQVAEISENESDYEFIYDAFGLIAVRDVTLDNTQVYFAPVPGETMLMTTENGKFWTLDDGPGDLSRFADADGIILDGTNRFSRNAFSEIIESADLMLQTDFIEQVYLSDADIFLMGVRAYHPRMGRFLQRDPVRHDPRGNLYTYAYNSPTNFSDPTGMTGEAAFEGLEPDIAIIDPASFVRQPTQAETPLLPDVAQLQSDENYRILDVAYTAEYHINDVAFHTAQSACDTYMPIVNPIDSQIHNQSGADRRALLAIYDSVNSWLPSSHPAIGHNPLAMNQLMQIKHLLALSLQGGRSSQACENAFNLPVIPRPDASDFYDSLANMRLLLNEVSLYPAAIDEISSLQAITTAEIIAPQVFEISINPTILPELPGQLSSLHEDTRALFTDILLPYTANTPFEWQQLNQAQNVSPFTSITIED